MKYVRLPLAAVAAAVLPALVSAQMHKVAQPDKVTRAVGVYEYVGDLQHPKAARLTPVSLFIGGHFEDAGVYLARPIPFALDSGLRYELQRAGVKQEYLDVVASRNFASTAAAAATPFDDGWFGYGRTAALPVPKAGKLRPNCGNAHAVEEADSTKKDDGKPHFGAKPAADTADQPAPKHTGRNAAPDPCREEPDYADRVSLADDSKKDSNTPDQERPTLHRSPETTAHNTGAAGKPDKKAPKPPPATITANGGPADDPDRPTIRHRTTDEDDPNNLPPDPIDLASKDRLRALAKADAAAVSTAGSTAAPTDRNDTVADGATISAGDTMTGRPSLHRGRPVGPPSDQTNSTKSGMGKAVPSATQVSPSASAIAPPLEAVVAVSDAKDRATHDFSYHFASTTERSAALDNLQSMARAVLANPALATDAPEGTKPPAAVPVIAKPATNGAAGTARSHTSARSTSAVRNRVRAVAPVAAPALTDETLNAYQLYFSAPVTYVYSARMPASGSTPDRFVTVIAQTDAEGKLQPAMRTVTDAAHLDRIPRYRLIDVVDADGSNRASLLMELRQQHTRQFALYRLLGNKPDQVFVTGTTLL